MTQLAQERCTACRRDSPSVTPDEIVALHPQTPDWELIDGDGIPKLDRVFRFRDFAQALEVHQPRRRIGGRGGPSSSSDH